jgi:hypothetical protein
VLDDDLVAEISRGPGAGVGDQCLVRVEFECEFIAQEGRQLIFDGLGFGFRSDEPQDVVVGLCGLPDYAGDAPGCWLCTGDWAGVVAIILSLSR